VSYQGTVRNGVVVLPPEAKLPEGSAVEVIPQDARATERMAKSGTRQSDRQRALDSLYAVFSESRAPGWDGHGARAASYESYLETKRFIEALPAEFAAPEIAMDPDGEVCLEWYVGAGRTVSVSIGPGGELSYAGKFSSSTKAHGTEPFTGEIPAAILGNLRRLAA